MTWTNTGAMQNTVPSTFLSPKKKARSAGTIEPYEFREIRPRKQLKEISKILRPEKKRFLGLKYGHQFDVKNRCVVCGTYHEWDASDPMRPMIPLTEVVKGRAMKGTYCPKHTNIFKQMEMLEQQIIAEKHGLEFKAYIPKPRILGGRGPTTSLNPQDVASLTAIGWEIKPPQFNGQTPPEQTKHLLAEIHGKLATLEAIMGVK